MILDPIPLKTIMYDYELGNLGVNIGTQGLHFTLCKIIFTSELSSEPVKHETEWIESRKEKTM